MPSRVAGDALVSGGMRHGAERRGIFREGAANQHAGARVLPGSQRGVALVLTLVMLAIITIVTVVFLSTARRNRQTTTLSLDRTAAEQSAADALQRASSQIIERILRDTNLLSIDFLVSQPAADLVPVFYSNGLPVHPLIPTVTNLSRSLGIYMDLNRSRFFDPGTIATNNRGYEFIPTPYRHGDPIWIGILDKPWAPPAPNNRFIARMAYAVLPTGNSLDLNTIHNESRWGLPGVAGEGFLRNQGFGPWELNLAAFLAELSPRVWGFRIGDPQYYSYEPVPQPVANGVAFVDARSIVDYRRNWTDRWAPLQGVFPFTLGRFPTASIDAYSDGIGNTGVVPGLYPFTIDNDLASKGNWSGTDSSNHFFHPQELFYVTNLYLPNKVTTPFFDRLTNAIGLDPSVYYRLISQLNTDSGTDFHDRINLNYADEHAGYSVTNFHSWDDPNDPPDLRRILAVAFFTNVAQRIFLAQSNEFNNLSTNALPIRSITEIPIYPTNLYSTAIHRILQEAANIFDATRTNPYPSVFRPLFGPGPMAGVNYIVGFTNDDRVSTLQTWLNANTNGIPMVIGAKKGLPNFNEFTLRTDFLVSRKLQLTRPDTASFPNATNQMYVLGISNYFGVEAWNSYYEEGSGGQVSLPYPRAVTLTVSNFATTWLNNGIGFQTNTVLTGATVTNIPAGTWQGGIDKSQQGTPFIYAMNTNEVFLNNAVYIFNGNYFANISTNQFESWPGFLLPYWVFTISNRLTYMMSEQVGGYDRIVDFVLLNDTATVDLYRDMLSGIDPYQGTGGTSPALSLLWSTNRIRGINGPTEGILQQLEISLGNLPTVNSEWRNYALTATAREQDKNNAIDLFRSFCGLAPLYGTIGTNSLLDMQAPFNPAAKLAVLSTWQVNDPLVHYHPADLRLGGSPTNHQLFFKPSSPATNIAPSSLGYLNDRYSPWGGSPLKSSDPNQYDRSVKDAGVYRSSDWAFPAQKLANIGMLGRIHRGTPWQTINFKSEAAPLQGNYGWTNVSPDIAARANGQIFSRTHPTNDWKLADLFTTALDERTSRGLVSVNQKGLETWSALLSGVVVLTNSYAAPQMDTLRDTKYSEMTITPWGTEPFDRSGLAVIWTNIYLFQTQTNMGVPLRNVGDILQVPQLTVESPFLNVEDRSNPQQQQRNFGVDDFAYEQIPQQILSLLRVGQSRFVIYAYGQALKPEQINPDTGRVANYQVTAEYATRAVVRVEGDPRSRVRLVVESFNVLPPD